MTRAPVTRPPEEREPPLGWLSLPPMRFPNHYVWFVFFSTLDVMLTWAILEKDGTEINPVAKLVIDEWDLPGALAFKFSLMLVVVLACEIIGRQRRRLARVLASFAVMVSAMPVFYSLMLLLVHVFWSKS